MFSYLKISSILSQRKGVLPKKKKRKEKVTKVIAMTAVKQDTKETKEKERKVITKLLSQLNM